jgi:hypothetical protein
VQYKCLLSIEKTTNSSTQTFFSLTYPTGFLKVVIGMRSLIGPFVFYGTFLGGANPQSVCVSAARWIETESKGERR